MLAGLIQQPLAYLGIGCLWQYACLVILVFLKIKGPLYVAKHSLCIVSTKAKSWSDEGFIQIVYLLRALTGLLWLCVYCDVSNHTTYLLIGLSGLVLIVALLSMHCIFVKVLKILP